MKATLLLVSFALCTTLQLRAVPRYVVFRKRIISGWKLEHVKKPERRLNRWAYDPNNDTYFRVKSSLGISVKAKVGKMSEHPEYVTVKQGWTAWKISSVDKPEKRLHKWYKDTETGSHYRIRYFWGNSGRIN